MENIIKKAIEGGFEFNEIIRDKYADNAKLQIFCIQPPFWQALGKSCGWHYTTTRYRCENAECRYSKDKNMYSVLDSYCSNCGVKKTPFIYEQKEWLKNAEKFHKINLTE